MARLAEADAILVCVPTPITRHQEPDLSYVVSTAEAIGRVAHAGQPRRWTGSTWPGTTRDGATAILERRAAWKSAARIFLAFSPEREDPGNANFKTRNHSEGSGAPDDAKSAALAVKLYEQIVAKVVAVRSSAVAEAAKLTENIYRAVNIALREMSLKVVLRCNGHR